MRGEEKKGEGEEKIKTDVRPVIQSLLPGLTPLDARQSHAAADFWRYTYPRLGMRGSGLLREHHRREKAFSVRAPNTIIFPSAEGN